MATRILTLLFISFFAEAQHKANFKAAEKFSQENLSKMLKSTSVFLNGLKIATGFGTHIPQLQGKTSIWLTLPSEPKQNFLII